MTEAAITKKFEKLLRIDISFTGKIQKIRLTGDFFLHPEDTISDIEDSIIGSAVPLDENKLLSKIKEALEKNNAIFVGITAENILETLKEAVK